MKPRIGWIGLGNMGIPMAGNLLRAGYHLTVYNRTPQKASPLVEAGAHTAVTPKQLAQVSDIVITMLANAVALHEVYSGEEGLLAGLDSGGTVIDMSTIGHAEAVKVAGLMEERGISFIDAPVSGSVKPAEDGQLVILAGGDQTAVDRCRPLFAVLGKETLYFGENGTGNLAKLVINLLLGITMQGIAESLVLAEKMGLDRQLVIKMMSLSAVNTPMLGVKTPGLLSESFPAAFALKWMEKDLGLAMETARGLTASLPLAANASATYTAAKARGDGELDVAAILLQLKAQSGL